MNWNMGILSLAAKILADIHSTSSAASHQWNSETVEHWNTETLKHWNSESGSGRVKGKRLEVNDYI